MALTSAKMRSVAGLLLLVAIVATTVRVTMYYRDRQNETRRRAEGFRGLALVHQTTGEIAEVFAEFAEDEQTRDWQHRRSQHFRELGQKYREAASNPGVALPPDPLEPEYR